MALTTPVGPVPTLPDSTAAEHQLATMLALFPPDELVTFVIELTRASPACEHEIWSRVHNVRASASLFLVSFGSDSLCAWFGFSGFCRCLSECVSIVFSAPIFLCVRSFSAV
jgi:hypothetical protein